DRSDVERTGRETVRPGRGPCHGRLAPRGAGRIPDGGHAPNLGCARGRIRVVAAKEATRPEAVVRAPESRAIRMGTPCIESLQITRSPAHGPANHRRSPAQG